MNELDLMTNEELFQYMARRFDKGMIIVGVLRENNSENVMAKTYFKHVETACSEIMLEEVTKKVNEKKYPGS